MKRILELIEKRTREEMKTHPFLDWLSSCDLSVKDRLTMWIPVISTFAMEFKDFCNLILTYPEEEALEDPLKASINHHAHEDGNHWRLLLKDLKTLNANKSIDIASTLNFLWGKDVEKQRKGFYEMIILVQKAKDPLIRFCLISALEKCGHALFSAATKLGIQFEKETGKRLYYLGQTHLDEEEGHLQCSPSNMSLEDEIWQKELTEEMYRDAEYIVNEIFDINYPRWTGYLDFVNGKTARFFIE